MRWQESIVETFLMTVVAVVFLWAFSSYQVIGDALYERIALFDVQKEVQLGFAL
jgi:hypothetical protein